ncbi:MAG: arsenate reductase ArsC [Pseudomonadota bacterium]
MTKRKMNVLFLCTANSARSILAEAILARKGAPAFNSYSAGSDPGGKVNPYALALLESMDFETRLFRSKDWAEFAGEEAPEMDFIFTVCSNAAGEVCPVWPGGPVSAHWGVPDPAAVEGSEADKQSAFAEAYRMLDARISKFLDLPLEGMDAQSLKDALDNIGREAYTPTQGPS